ncbi:cytotoxic and regulatory T-cell molecule [Triplophysa rosa]|uniref:Cytotoxic and regulatory T-cell molecule n=1 Tax=Triplophysa rosa TaxID=992332 RepID=A0A9W7TC83_TRIRA|nr:cytotoxic and regulatory T-cell molecule [Triplophysa rosa]KAI7793808.1 putative cytotoxic and regulatory T-cell molecule [Triplophysa rosa]
MEIKNTFVIHILMLIAGGIGECLAVKHLILTEGDTLVLKCLKNSIGNVHMEWRNPQGHVLFFNKQKGLKDSRIHVFSLNDSEFTIHLSNIQLKDEGVYKCLEYDDKIITKRYRVKVLGTPRIEMTEHGDHKIIKCTTAANDHPPELSWLLSGIEIEAQPNTSWEGGSNRSSVVSVLKVKTHIRKATVKCLAKHRALPKPLVDFIIIENDSVTVSTSSYSRTTDKQITETMITVTSAAFISTEHMDLTSVSERPEVTSTTESTTLNSAQTQYTDTSDNNSTEGFQIQNATSSEGFVIENKHHPDHQIDINQSSPLLVLLVTCLILCLLIVVIFFAIKLRRAHLAWKRENEESDQSVESSKSKSSHEEKQAQERRRKGFWNSNFTEYKVEEETPQNVTNSSSTREAEIRETEDSSRTASSKLEETCVKETEL